MTFKYTDETMYSQPYLATILEKIEEEETNKSVRSCSKQYLQEGVVGLNTAATRKRMRKHARTTGRSALGG
jgi:hypothetical protein